MSVEQDAVHVGSMDVDGVTVVDGRVFILFVVVVENREVVVGKVPMVSQSILTAESVEEDETVVTSASLVVDVTAVELDETNVEEVVERVVASSSSVVSHRNHESLFNSRAAVLVP